MVYYRLRIIEFEGKALPPKAQEKATNKAKILHTVQEKEQIRIVIVKSSVKIKVHNKL